MFDSKTVLLFLGMCLATRVNSAPTVNGLEVRGTNVFSDNWTTPAFLACMRKKFPNFPDGVTSSTDLHDCRNSLGKRDVDDEFDPNDIIGKLDARDADEQYDPADIVGKLDTRGFDNQLQSRTTLIELGDKLTDFQNLLPECHENALPKNFEEAAPMRAKAEDICKKMGDSLMEKGWAAIEETLPDAWTKHDLWLYNNKKVILYVSLAMTPQGRAALKAAKVTQGTAVAICTAALTKLSTKGDGCTQELNYSEGHGNIFGKHATTTGVTDGVMDLFFKNNYLGCLSTSFDQPK